MEFNHPSTPSVSNRWMNAFALALVVVAAGLLGFKNYDRADKDGPTLHLLNVSYDPTRELYAQLNPRFLAQYARDTGHTATIEQSHGGSSRQARAVADGDWRRMWSRSRCPRTWKACTGAGWSPTTGKPASRMTRNRIPPPSFSVVRRTNPKHIHDWPDLLAPGVEIVTPNPKNVRQRQAQRARRLGIGHPSRRHGGAGARVS